MLKKIPQAQWHNSMRGYFAGSLYNLMIDNPKIVVVTMDLGYGLFDKIRDDFPERFYNVGAAEQAGVGVAIGLALEGFIPITYSITSFLLRRPYETIKLYVNDEVVPVRLIGGGRDKDYTHDGKSHWSEDAPHLLDGFPYIKQYWPDTKDEISQIVKELVLNNRPSFVSLAR